VTPRAPGPDLAVTKTASVRAVPPGAQVSYQLVVHNHGPGQATGVTLEDPSRSGMFFEAANPKQGHCTITRALRCVLGTVQAGGQALVQVTATAAADATGRIVNQATVWGNERDPNPSNDTATSIVEVTPPPGPPGTGMPPPGPGTPPPTQASRAQAVSDLRAQLHGPNRHVRVGQRRTFTITVTNHGPDPARAVVITFTASLRLRLISAHAVRDGCTATVPVRCELGTLAVRGRVILRIVAVPRVSGVLTTAAAVMSHSRDPAPHSSVAVARTTILAARTAAPTPPRVTG
jgi:uncharacterized repeat protein (TIGR01451 family)